MGVCTHTADRAERRQACSSSHVSACPMKTTVSRGNRAALADLATSGRSCADDLQSPLISARAHRRGKPHARKITRRLGGGGSNLPRSSTNTAPRSRKSQISTKQWPICRYDMFGPGHVAQHRLTVSIARFHTGAKRPRRRQQHRDSHPKRIPVRPVPRIPQPSALRRHIAATTRTARAVPHSLDAFIGASLRHYDHPRHLDKARGSPLDIACRQQAGAG